MPICQLCAVPVTRHQASWITSEFAVTKEEFLQSAPANFPRRDLWGPERRFVHSWTLLSFPSYVDAAERLAQVNQPIANLTLDCAERFR